MSKPNLHQPTNQSPNYQRALYREQQERENNSKREAELANTYTRKRKVRKAHPKAAKESIISLFLKAKQK